MPPTARHWASPSPTATSRWVNIPAKSIGRAGLFPCPALTSFCARSGQLLYIVEVSRYEFLPIPFECHAGRDHPGYALGNHGHRRVHHLPHSGRGRPDGGRKPCHRRRGVRHAHARRVESLGRAAVRVPGGCPGGAVYRPAPYPVRNPCHSGRYPYPAGTVLR